MGPLERSRYRQLNAAVYQYLQNVAPRAAEQFKSDLTATGLLDSAASSRLEPDTLYRKWSSIASAQLKLNEYDEKLKALQKKIDFYENVGVKTEKITLDSVPRAKPLQTLQGHTQPVRQIHFHPFLPLLVSCADDGLIMIWDCENGGVLQKTLRQHTAAVLDVQFDAKGEWMASASADTSVKLWHCVGFECFKTLFGHTDTVSSVRFLQKSERLLSCSKDTTIRVWDAFSGVCLMVCNGHRDWARTLSVSEEPMTRVNAGSNATTFASAGNDTSIFLWSYEEGNKSSLLPLQFTAHEHVVEYICFATVSMFEALQDAQLLPFHLLKKAQNQNASKELLTPQSNGVDHRKRQDNAATVSSLLLSASRDCTVKLWDTAEGACLQTFRGHENWVKQLVIHPSGCLLLSCSDDRSIRIWDIVTGSCRLVLPQAHRSFINCLDFNPRVLIMASGGAMSEILLWDSSPAKQHAEEQQQLFC